MASDNGLVANGSGGPVASFSPPPSSLRDSAAASKFGIESESLDSLTPPDVFAVPLLPHKPNDNFDRGGVEYGLKPCEPLTLALRRKSPAKPDLMELESGTSRKAVPDDRRTPSKKVLSSLGDGIPIGFVAARRCSVEAVSSTLYSSAMPRLTDPRLVILGSAKVLDYSFHSPTSVLPLSRTPFRRRAARGDWSMHQSRHYSQRHV